MWGDGSETWEGTTLTAQIRNFSPHRDLRTVLQFQYEIYEHNFPGFRVDKGFLDDYARQLRAVAHSHSEQIWVLEMAGEVRGFVWGALITSMVDEFVGYIKNVYVAPEIRRQGYAKRLIAVAEDWFRSQGAPKASLDASVCNQPVVAFYEKTGYHITRARMEKLL